MKATFLRVLKPLASLRLAMIAMAAALVLVFGGTMAQRTVDIQVVQELYFQSWIVWWQAGPGTLRIPVFPGGHLLGAVLLVNLLAALVLRVRWSWNKAGVILVHVGLVILLLGGLATDLFSLHSYMQLYEGETKNYSEDDRRVELAVTDASETEYDSVIAIPGEALGRGGTLEHARLPFRMVLRGYYQNSMLSSAGQGSQPSSSQGTGTRVAVRALPPATGVNERNTVSAVLEIIPNGGESMGTWLMSEALVAAQEISVGGKTWTLQLRPARYYKPYSLTLVEFSHKVYAGSSIPKDFSSHVLLKDFETGENRPVRIFMNNPLRYRGDTYYQASFKQDRPGTVLQVVRNPGYQAPYLATTVISLGMVWQFLIHLSRFVKRRGIALSASKAS